MQKSKKKKENENGKINKNRNSIYEVIMYYIFHRFSEPNRTELYSTVCGVHTEYTDSVHTVNILQYIVNVGLG